MASSNENINPTLSSTSSPHHGGVAKPDSVSLSAPLTGVVFRDTEPVADGSLGAGLSVGSAENNGSGSGTNAGKKPAWNRPANGTGPIMEPSMWPALGESAKGTASKSFSDLSDGSSSSSGSQRIGTASSSQEPGGHNTNNNATSNHLTARQRSMRRNGSNSSFNGGTQHQHMSAPPSSSTTLPLNNHSPRDQSQQRNTYRNRNGGSNSRGDGSYYHNYGNRRDQYHGNQDWGSHQNFNGRGVHMPPQRGGPRFIRPSSTPTPVSAPLMPLPMRPFPVPMPYPGLVHQMYYGPLYQDMRGVQYASPNAPPTVYMGPMDHQLPQRIVNQVDYYFSNENLVKDIYLRKKMDSQGWVSIGLIAGFRKMTELTNDLQMITDSLQYSTNVEVQGDRVRKRNDWGRWIMPPLQFSEVTGPQSLGANNQEMLLVGVQNISLEGRTAAMDRPQSSFQHASTSEEVNTRSAQPPGVR